MPYPHGRARISRSKPQAQGVCNRCGFRYQHKDLHWQFDWCGARLMNLRILVCDGCCDIPQENIRTIILPADPPPILNPRPEWFPQDDNPISGIGWDPARLFQLGPPNYVYSAFYGTLTGNGGPDAAFFGGQKPLSQSATFAPSSTGANSVAINWSAAGGSPLAPSSLAMPQGSYVINQAIVYAPTDGYFLKGSAPTMYLMGSSDGQDFTVLGTAASAGTIGESVTINSASTVFYPYHLVGFIGDGVNQAAISLALLYTTGPNSLQTGSELGA